MYLHLVFLNLCIRDSAYSVRLGFEKLRAPFRPGKSAVIVSAEEAVTDAGDEVVRGIQHEIGEDSEGNQYAPKAAQAIKNVQNRTRFRQDALFGTIAVDDDANRFESSGVQAVFGENGRRQRALQRGEPKTIGAIAFEDESDGSIAEAAFAVVEDKRMIAVVRHVRRSVSDRVVGLGSLF